MRITGKRRPKRNQGGPSAIRVFAFLDATAAVRVLAGPAGETFTFAFIQVCRPFDVIRAVYHEAGTSPGHEIDWNPGDATPATKGAKTGVVRSQLRLPAFDVLPGGRFTPMVAVKGDPKQGEKKRPPVVESRQITQGRLGDLFFEDAPQISIETAREHRGKFYDSLDFTYRTSSIPRS